MDTLIEQYTHEDLKIDIYLDETAESPRHWDNLGRLILFGRYGYMDVNEVGKEYRPSKYSGWNEFEEAILSDHPGAEILPVYRYEHSGVMYNTTGFSCPWDSCQVGFIVCPRESILKEFSAKRVTANLRGKVREVLKSEIDTYSTWASGDVYGYVVTDVCNNSINLDGDSCWGFYGIGAVKDAANEAAEAIAPEYFASAESRQAVREAVACEDAGQQRLAFA